MKLIKLICLFLVVNVTLCSKAYRYYSYSEMVTIMKEMANRYPKYVKLETTQQKYGIFSPGSCGNGPCEQHMLTISNFEIKRYKAEVYFSGCLHGNERIGPNAVIEAAMLLISNKMKETGVNNLYDYDDIPYNPWLSQLLDKRVIIMTPMTNHQGYYKNQRGENGVDPNRDFPFGFYPLRLLAGKYSHHKTNRRSTVNKCLQSATAQGVHEIFLHHKILLALTFHGGCRTFGYEWGAPQYKTNTYCPDDTSQKLVSSNIVKIGGSYDGYYPVGPINKLVYAVQGGAEDWAYGASWDKEYTQCETNPNYPRSRLQYNDMDLRSNFFLVETSDAKIPSSNTLGNSRGLMTSSTTGHIAKNIHVILATIDIAEPYIFWPFKNNIMKTTSNSVNINFGIGGSLLLDSIEVYYTANLKSIDFPEPSKLSQDSIESFYKNFEFNKLDDIKIEHKQRPNQFNADHNLLMNNTIKYEMKNECCNMIYIKFSVDQNWATNSISVAPNLKPQTHFSNLRTNPNWRFNYNGETIHGRVYWFSDPLIVMKSDCDMNKCMKKTTNNDNNNDRDNNNNNNQNSNNNSQNNNQVNENTPKPTHFFCPTNNNNNNNNYSNNNNNSNNKVNPQPTNSNINNHNYNNHNQNTYKQNKSIITFLFSTWTGVILVAFASVGFCCCLFKGFGFLSGICKGYERIN